MENPYCPRCGKDRIASMSERNFFVCFGCRGVFEIRNVIEDAYEKAKAMPPPSDPLFDFLEELGQAKNCSSDKGVSK